MTWIWSPLLLKDVLHFQNQKLKHYAFYSVQFNYFYISKQTFRQFEIQSAYTRQRPLRALYFPNPRHKFAAALLLKIAT